jgi:hypothetical protein
MASMLPPAETSYKAAARPHDGHTRLAARRFESLKSFYQEGNVMGTILLIILIILLLGSMPTWPYSAGWGYYPSGGLGLVLVVVLVLVIVGRL